MSTYQPIKVFELTNVGTLTHKHLELRHNGAVILWVNTEASLLHATRVNLHTQSQNGPIIAAAQLKGARSGCRVVLGNPDLTAKEQWQNVEAQGMGNNRYGFWSNGVSFAWKRTHDKDLGASGLRSNDFKLVDMANPDQILAVYITGRKFLNTNDVARIDFMVELGQDVELTSVVAILGIATHLRKASNVSAAGAFGAFS